MITPLELIEEHKRLCSEYYQKWRDSSPFSSIDDEGLFVCVGKILQSEYYLRINAINGVCETEKFFKEKGEFKYGCYDEINRRR